MKTHIITDCGHRYNTGWTANVLAGCTADCRRCGALLIFPVETTVGSCVRARDFHHWMNEQWNLWPVDGTNTYSVGF